MPSRHAAAMPGSPRTRPTPLLAGPSRRGRGRHHLAVAGVGVAVLLAGCGDDEMVVEDGTDATDVTDVVDEEGEDAGGATDDGAEESTDEDAAGDTESGDDEGAEDTDDAGEQDGEQEDADEDTGFAQHAAPDSIDCSNITEESVGAVILFPDADDASTLDAGPGPVTVEVAGCSDTFEANLQYEAYHGQDANPTLSGFTSGGTMGNWEAFSISETYWTPGPWTVIVFDDDAESGERVEFDEVTFTID